MIPPTGDPPPQLHRFDGDLGYAPRVMHRAQTLVVVCNTLVSQWQREISKFTGGQLRCGGVSASHRGGHVDSDLPPPSCVRVCSCSKATLTTQVHIASPQIPTLPLPLIHTSHF